MSHGTSLRLINKSSNDLHITCNGTNNRDWDGSSRPDHNFNNVDLASGAAREEPEELNSHTSSAWYTLHMTPTKGGATVDLRNDQHDAYHSLQRRYQEGNGVVITQLSGGDDNTFDILPGYDRASWMSRLSDDTPLTCLTLPGTHDSWALIGSFNNLARCQSVDLNNQFPDGIRFIDIRARHYQNGLPLHHGSVYQERTFTDVLHACDTFLSQHPTEAIVMSLKDEYDAADNTRTYQETVQYYLDNETGGSRVLRGTTIPNLRDARGKVVLLRRFQSKIPLGVDMTNWDDDAWFTKTNSDGVTYCVQDLYKVDASADNKVKQVLGQVDAARKGDPSTLYINFMSGVDAPNNPEYTADKVNPRVYEYFMNDITMKQRDGIVAADFYNSPDSLIDMLISANFM